MKRKEYKIAQLYSYCNEETVDITQQPIDDSVRRGGQYKQGMIAQVASYTWSWRGMSFTDFFKPSLWVSLKWQ